MPRAELAPHDQRNEVRHRRGLGPRRYAIGNDDPWLFSFGPDVPDDVDQIAAGERTGAQDRDAGARGVRVEDTRVAMRAETLERAMTAGRLAFIDLDVARGLESGFLHHALDAEGAAAPGLAIEAVAGVDGRQAIEADRVAHRAANASALKSFARFHWHLPFRVSFVSSHLPFPARHAINVA